MAETLTKRHGLEIDDDAERPNKRVRMSVEPPNEDGTASPHLDSEEEGNSSHATHETRPSDLYLDTASSVFIIQVSHPLTLRRPD
jgi:hypothetical protein